MEETVDRHGGIGGVRYDRRARRLREVDRPALFPAAYASPQLEFWELWEEGRIRTTLQHVWPLPERAPPAVLHGDFRPGNVLWRDGRIVGVLDWENVTLGDPLADLATSRLEMLWACGEDAMRSFTHRYRQVTRRNLSSLPYWDLAIALRYGPLFTDWTVDPAIQDLMRERHRWFIAQAFSVLDRQGRCSAPSVSSVVDRDPGRRA